MTIGRYGRRLCGEQAVCTRPAGHRGHHGGFRPAAFTMAEVRGVRITPMEMDVLRTYARIGNQKEAATELGMTLQTVKNHCMSAYRKLDVTSAIEAFTVMGWLTIPSDEELVAGEDRNHAAALRGELARLAADAEALAQRVTHKLAADG